MAAKQKSKAGLDAVLFASFIVAFLLEQTGLGWHQAIGVGAGVLAAVHLAMHWEWVKAVTRRFFGRARLVYLVDAALAAGFFSSVGTGLVISSWLSLSLPNYAAWRLVHVEASIVSLLATVLKIGLHWRWIAAAARGWAARPAAPAGLRPVGQLASRRDFLKVMGVTGAAALIALGESIPGLQNGTGGTLVQASSLSPATGAAQSAAPVALASQGNPASACTVRCPKGCAFPGRCRRYTDSNGNGRCDLGECS